MKKLTLIVAAVFPLLCLSCSKEGPAGAQGPAGENGNANVKVYEKDITGATWTASGNHSFLNVAAPAVLTAAALEANTVLVYVYTSDFGGWGLVPYATERGIRVTAEVSVGAVKLRKDQNGTPTTQSWHNRVRVILIANAAAPAPLGRAAYSNASFDDFPAGQVHQLQ